MNNLAAKTVARLVTIENNDVLGVQGIEDTEQTDNDPGEEIIEKEFVCKKIEMIPKENNKQGEKLNMTPIVKLKRLPINLLSSTKHGTVHFHDEKNEKSISKDVEMPTEDFSEENQTFNKRKNFVEHFQDFIKKKGVCEQKKVTDYYRPGISRNKCSSSDTVNTNRPTMLESLGLQPVLSPLEREAEAPNREPSLTPVFRQTMSGTRGMTKLSTTREEDPDWVPGSKALIKKTHMPCRLSPREVQAVQLQRIENVHPLNAPEKLSTSIDTENQTKNLSTVEIGDLMNTEGTSLPMALPRGQREPMKRGLGQQMKRGSLRMNEHSVTAIGLGEQGIVGTSMAMSFQRGRGEPWRRGVSRMMTPSMRGLEEQRKRGASRMRSNSVRGLGEPSVAAGSRIRSSSLGGLGEGKMDSSGMLLPSVRGLGEHSHRISEGERMRFSAGRGLGHSKMTDGDQMILPLGRGGGDPRMRGFGRMISPTIRGGGDPRMRGFGRMISPTIRGRGDPRMRGFGRMISPTIRGGGGLRMNRETSIREANSNAHINQMEGRHNISGGGSGIQIPEGIDHGNQVSSTNQEVIEVIDISEDYSPLDFGSNASLEEAGSSGSILQNSPTVRDSSPILNKLKNRDVSVSVSLKKELELPPGFKLPPDITVIHLPSTPSLNQKNVLTPERIVKILSGNDSLPKKKVELELSDPQIEIMMELGLM